MRRDEMCEDLLVLGMKGLMVHSLLCVIYNIASEKTMRMNLQLLILYIPMLLFAVIRRKCRRYSLFLLSHILISGIFVLYFPELEERIVFGGGAAFLAFASMHVRLKDMDPDIREACPSIAYLVLFFVSYLSAWQSQRAQVMKICYYEVFLFLILFAVYQNLSGTTIFLKSNERIENLPVNQMKSISRILLGIFLIFFIAGMLLIPYLPVSSLTDGAGRLLRILIRRILMFLLWIFTREAPQMEFFEENAQGEMPMTEGGEGSALAQFLSLLLVAVVGILLAAGAVYLLARTFYELYRRFYEKHPETADDSEFLWENPLKVRIVKNRQKKQLQADWGINQKIRHLYKKNIRKQFGASTQIPSAKTATELEQILMEETAEGWEQKEQKIRLYHKARYSQHECSRQELEAMKQIYKKNKRS